MEVVKKPHVICIPAPGQGHINFTFKLAKLLHSKGIYITFVLTEFDLARLTKSLGSDSPIFNLNDFRFEAFADGLPQDSKRGVHDLPAMCVALQGEGKESFRSLLKRLLASTDIPPVTCVISDAHLLIQWEVCQELGVRVLLFYTTSPCADLGFLHYEELIERGLFPLKDESCLTNGFLDTPVDWIPGLMEGATLKHLPSFVRTTDANESMFNYNIKCAKCAVDSTSIILNTFDDLDVDVIEGIKTKIPNVSTIGPISLLCQQANVQISGSNLWKEDTKCLEWLDNKNANSVIYVNYGSLTTLTTQQLEEFAWGLANSKHSFLWVVRDDLVNGESGILINEEYMEEIEERGLISGWCPQEKVLKHPSVAVFLTHCGWNSTLETISEGVPMICWPFFADQQTNCWYACKKWGIGMELGDGSVDRKKVKEVVREMMEGEKGEEIRRNALEWKKKADKATRPGGSSHCNFDNLITWLMEK